MASKKKDLVAEAKADEAVGPEPGETAKAKAVPPGERLKEAVTANPPDADIAATTGTLAGSAVAKPMSGTVERTPIVGAPEVVVVAGVPEEAPRIGPNWERERYEAEQAKKATKA